MTVGIGAAGILGVAHEAVQGTYVAPTKFFPIRSETLSHSQETNWRREIRGVADIHGAVAGNANIAGTIEVTVEHDAIVYLLYAARATVVKAGTDPDFTYTFTPSHAAEAPNKTLSVSIERNGEVFGYVGCVVTSMEWSIDNGLLICSMNVIGENEASESALTPTFAGTAPFGAGTYNLEIPTNTQTFDVDSFTLTIDDSGEPQYRLRNDRTTPSFIKFGERSVTLSVTKDFHDRTEYDAYKALTAQSVTLRAELTAARYIEFVIPSIIKDTYELGLSSQGDLVMATINYNGVHGGSPIYTIEVGTSSDIT